MKNLFVAIVATTAFLSGCVHSSSSGKKIDQDQAAAIQKGVTTRADLLNQFGPPTGTSLINGDQVLRWTYAKSTMKRIPFSPSMSSENESSSFSATLDKNGVVKDVIYLSNGG